MSFGQKLKAFFTSYRGLISFLFGWILLLTMFLSTFSYPMVERFGEAFPWLFPLMDLPVEGHTSRTIMLYHSLAIPFLVIVAYMVMQWYATRPSVETHAKWALFVGAMTSSIFGMDFGFFSTSWTSHALFIAGQTITFYGAVLMIIAIWPTKNFPTAELEPMNDCMMPVKGGKWNWEYFNMAITIIALLTSAVIGAIAGANYGQPDQVLPGEPPKTWLPVLAESIVRNEDHNVGWSYHEMMVSHLHIMLALLAGAVMLLTIRKANMTGKWFRYVHWLYTPGVIILAIGAWLVVTPLTWAHVVINVGAGFLLLVGGIASIYGWIDISKRHLGEGYADASAGERVKASFSDPVKWGLFFQLWWVNVVSTFPGVYVAVNLEDGRDFRSLEMVDVEYSFNVGHWHVLGVLIAIMMALIIADEMGVANRWNKVIGWTAIVGTIVSFGFATIYMLREPTADVEFDFIMMDIGLAILYVAVVGLGIWILIDHFKNNDK